MNSILILEQCLNGIQFGLMLFLLTAGLTLVFGVMDTINLAHGSLYMTGAFFAASVSAATGSFLLGLLGAITGTALLGAALEIALLRRLYQRDHLTQVLATFALILVFNEVARMIWGPQPLALNVPKILAGPVELLPGFFYPAYRLLIIAIGLSVAAGLYFFIGCTRAGMLVRAGASNRAMAPRRRSSPTRRDFIRCGGADPRQPARCSERWAVGFRSSAITPLWRSLVQHTT